MPSFTSTPEIPAPQLFCPTCEQPLVYRQTMFTRFAPADRWDFFECRMCGPFEYRHRTQRLVPAVSGNNKP
jgi:RNase P subunit RPR2